MKPVLFAFFAKTQTLILPPVSGIDTLSLSITTPPRYLAKTNNNNGGGRVKAREGDAELLTCRG